MGFNTAVLLAAWLVELMTDREPPLVVNLNAPAVPLDALPGVRAGTLSRLGSIDLAWHVDSTALEVVRVSHEPPFLDGSDAELLAQGYAALTGITGPWTDRRDVADLADALDLRLRQTRFM